MTIAGKRCQRVSAGLFVALSALFLSACGGGSDFGGSVPAGVAPEPQATASNTHVRRRALSYDRKGVTAIVVAPGGNTIGVANSDGRVSLMDGSGALEIRMLKPDGSAASSGLIFSADGRYLVTVGRDSVAQVWSVETGEPRLTLRGHESALRSVAASADGSLIATGGEETRVMLWDGTTGRLKRSFTGNTDFVNSVSLSRDGALLASGDAAARILIWDTATGRLLHTFLGHSNEVNAVAFSADGKLLASAGEDGKVFLWDVTTGLQVQRLEGQHVAVRTLTFSADGGLLGSGAVDGKVVVWDMTARSVVQDTAGSTGAVNAIAFNGRDSSQLLVGSDENRVRSLNVSRSAAR